MAASKREEEQLTPDATVPSSCASTITPTCLQDLYNIPTTPAKESSNILGVTGYINQWPNDDDLSTFLSDYRTDISSSTTFTLQTIDGGSDPQTQSEAGDEAVCVAHRSSSVRCKS